VPSRFLDELPEAHVEVKEPAGGSGGFGMSGYGASRFDEMNSFGSNYSTPGWQRAQRTKEARKGKGGFDETGQPYGKTGRQGGPGGRGGFSENGEPKYVPDGIFNQDEDYAEAAPQKPTKAPARRPKPLTIEGELVAKSTGATSDFAVGNRVFHQKFGNGNVTAVDGNKLTIKFDHAGEKRVVDSFVERV
jgi:DNA helicase-2/ATP-dependent DNA helicase PcrA